MDVSSTPKLELKSILETYVVITTFEESKIYLLDIGRGSVIVLLAEVLKKLVNFM
jgi:hypothetical protein